MSIELNLVVPASEEVIKREVKRLSEEIEKRKAEINLLKHGVSHYQSLCSHPGQKTGYNERDGSWGSPCPICGYAY